MLSDCFALLAMTGVCGVDIESTPTYIAHTGTIIVALSSADNSFFVQMTAPVPRGMLALSSALNAL